MPFGSLWLETEPSIKIKCDALKERGSLVLKSMELVTCCASSGPRRNHSVTESMNFIGARVVKGQQQDVNQANIAGRCAMYCPRCGHQPTANELRFCSYCGFKLGVVKASLADDDAVSATDFFTIQVPKELRQRDINIGLILMFAGTMLTALLAGRDFGREGGAIMLFAVFSSLLLFSKPIIKLIYKLLSWEVPAADSVSLNQRGMSFGAILMFVSTIFLALSFPLMFGRMRTPEFFVGLLVAFVLLLALSKYLMRAIRYLVAGDMSLSGKDLTSDSILAAASNPALTAAQNIPVSLFTAQRVNTAEIVSPTSITEHTTNLLENK
jgi:hypothetical protein